MLSFEITRSAIDAPGRCTISGAYSGARCPERGTVALDIVARFEGERGREPFRNYRLCPSDAALFIDGYRHAGAPVELINA
jgi:hypothetical protein